MASLNAPGLLQSLFDKPYHSLVNGISLTWREAESQIDDDIANLVQAREAIVRASLRCCLLFSKTAPAFNEPELELFRQLQDQHIPVILFSAMELEPYEPYIDADDHDELPYPYAFSFDEMARNSAHRYPRLGRP